MINFHLWNQNHFLFRNLVSSENSRDDLFRIFQQSSGLFTTIEYDVGDLEILQKIIDMNRYSIENVMNLIQTSCDELFVKCQFEGEFVNCSDLFKPVTSQYGLCCAFNKNGQYKWVFVLVSNEFETWWIELIDILNEKNLFKFITRKWQNINVSITSAQSRTIYIIRNIKILDVWIKHIGQCQFIRKYIITGYGNFCGPNAGTHNVLRKCRKIINFTTKLRIWMGRTSQVLMTK